MAPTPPPPVLWVTVPKPTFDLIGVVLGSLSLAVTVAVVGILLGIVLGLVFVRRKHDQEVLRLDLFGRR
jgi:ABC-type spermidine/putrescine transport system permease subunit II